MNNNDIGDLFNKDRNINDNNSVFNDLNSLNQNHLKSNNIKQVQQNSQKLQQNQPMTTFEKTVNKLQEALTDTTKQVFSLSQSMKTINPEIIKQTSPDYQKTKQVLSSQLFGPIIGSLLSKQMTSSFNQGKNSFNNLRQSFGNKSNNQNNNENNNPDFSEYLNKTSASNLKNALNKKANGFTVGRQKQPAGIVHGGEYVINKPQLDYLKQTNKPLLDKLEQTNKQFSKFIGYQSDKNKKFKMDEYVNDLLTKKLNIPGFESGGYVQTESKKINKLRNTLKSTQANIDKLKKQYMSDLPRFMNIKPKDNESISQMHLYQDNKQARSQEILLDEQRNSYLKSMDLSMAKILKIQEETSGDLDSSDDSRFSEIYGVKASIKDKYREFLEENPMLATALGIAKRPKNLGQTMGSLLSMKFLFSSIQNPQMALPAFLLGGGPQVQSQAFLGKQGLQAGSLGMKGLGLAGKMAGGIFKQNPLLQSSLALTGGIYGYNAIKKKWNKFMYSKHSPYKAELKLQGSIEEQQLTTMIGIYEKASGIYDKMHVWMTKLGLVDREEQKEHKQRIGISLYDVLQNRKTERNEYTQRLLSSLTGGKSADQYMSDMMEENIKKGYTQKEQARQQKKSYKNLRNEAKRNYRFEQYISDDDVGFSKYQQALQQFGGDEDLARQYAFDEWAQTGKGKRMGVMGDIIDKYKDYKQGMGETDKNMNPMEGKPIYDFLHSFLTASGAIWNTKMVLKNFKRWSDAGYGMYKDITGKDEKIQKKNLSLMNFSDDEDVIGALASFISNNTKNNLNDEETENKQKNILSQLSKNRNDKSRDRIFNLISSKGYDSDRQKYITEEILKASNNSSTMDEYMNNISDVLSGERSRIKQITNIYDLVYNILIMDEGKKRDKTYDKLMNLLLSMGFDNNMSVDVLNELFSIDINELTTNKIAEIFDVYLEEQEVDQKKLTRNLINFGDAVKNVWNGGNLSSIPDHPELGRHLPFLIQIMDTIKESKYQGEDIINSIIDSPAINSMKVKGITEIFSEDYENIDSELFRLLKDNGIENSEDVVDDFITYFQSQNRNIQSGSMSQTNKFMNVKQNEYVNSQKVESQTSMMQNIKTSVNEILKVIEDKSVDLLTKQLEKQTSISETLINLLTYKKNSNDEQSVQGLYIEEIYDIISKFGKGLNLPGFKIGKLPDMRYTGDGDKDEAQGIVHKGEMVLSSDFVQKLSQKTLNKLRMMDLQIQNDGQLELTPELIKQLDKETLKKLVHSSEYKNNNKNINAYKTFANSINENDDTMDMLGKIYDELSQLNSIQKQTKKILSPNDESLAEQLEGNSLEQFNEENDERYENNKNKKKSIFASIKDKALSLSQNVLKGDEGKQFFNIPNIKNALMVAGQAGATQTVYKLIGDSSFGKWFAKTVTGDEDNVGAKIGVTAGTVAVGAGQAIGVGKAIGAGAITKLISQAPQAMGGIMKISSMVQATPAFPVVAGIAQTVALGKMIYDNYQEEKQLRNNTLKYKPEEYQLDRTSMIKKFQQDFENNNINEKSLFYKGMNGSLSQLIELINNNPELKQKYSQQITSIAYDDDLTTDQKTQRIETLLKQASSTLNVGQDFSMNWKTLEQAGTGMYENIAGGITRTFAKSKNLSSSKIEDMSSYDMSIMFDPDFILQRQREIFVVITTEYNQKFKQSSIYDKYHFVVNTHEMIKRWDPMRYYLDSGVIKMDDPKYPILESKLTQIKNKVHEWFLDYKEFVDIYKEYQKVKFNSNDVREEEFKDMNLRKITKSYEESFKKRFDDVSIGDISNDKLMNKYINKENPVTGTKLNDLIKSPQTVTLGNLYTGLSDEMTNLTIEDLKDYQSQFNSTDSNYIILDEMIKDAEGKYAMYKNDPESYVDNRNKDKYNFDTLYSTEFKPKYVSTQQKMNQHQFLKQMNDTDLLYNKDKQIDVNNKDKYKRINFDPKARSIKSMEYINEFSDELKSPIEGKVIETFMNDKTYGNAIKVKQPNGRTLIIANLDEYDVDMNQTLNKGDIIGHHKQNTPFKIYSNKSNLEKVHEEYGYKYGGYISNINSYIDSGKEDDVKAVIHGGGEYVINSNQYSWLKNNFPNFNNILQMINQKGRTNTLNKRDEYKINEYLSDSGYDVKYNQIIDSQSKLKDYNRLQLNNQMIEMDSNDDNKDEEINELKSMNEKLTNKIEEMSNVLNNVQNIFNQTMNTVNNTSSNIVNNINNGDKNKPDTSQLNSWYQNGIIRNLQ